MNSNIKRIEKLSALTQGMKHVPSSLYYIGNLDLLKRPKIAIVGTRRPITYTKNQTYTIAQQLSRAGICIVSGGAIGVDTLAHEGAGVDNTIMVAGTGLDKRYPAINDALIKNIEEQGLMLSQFATTQPSFKWNFPMRNELIVALGSVLIITQADIKSGTMHSAQFALKMNKKIYVLPHRLGESDGTNYLLSKGLAEPLFDVDALIEQYGDKTIPCNDEFLNYCETFPLYSEAVTLHAQKVFEYECLGKIIVENGRIKRV